MTRNEKLAWAAGLFDGEGTIGYDPRGRMLRLRVQMTHEPTVRRFARTFPRAAAHFMWYRTKGHRLAITWNCQRTAAVKEVLESLLPYLVAKRREARIALTWVRARRLHNGVRYSPREIARARRLYLALRAEKEAVGRC